MIRLSKLTDYGLVLMTCIARDLSLPLRTARDLAVESKLPLPTVGRLLKQLSQSGLLVSQRGTKGGYSLVRDPRRISLEEIIKALEGPIALTECSTGVAGMCDLEACCVIKNNQQLISQALRTVLENVTLSDLSQSLKLTTIRSAQGKLVATIGLASGRIQ